MKIDMTGAALTLDLYLTVEFGHPIPEVAENAQKAVISSVEAMTGLHRGRSQYPCGRRDPALTGKPERERKGRIELWYGIPHGKLPSTFPMS